MTITAAIIIAFAIAMAVGPIMLMRPSPRQAKLANLRTLANKAGCRVRMAKHPTEKSVGELACYSLPWPSPQSKQFQSVQLSIFKRKYTHELHFFGYWDLQSKQVEAHTFDVTIQNEVKELLAELPESVYGIELNKLGVAVCLKEKLNKPETEILAEYMQYLQALRGIFTPAVFES